MNIIKIREELDDNIESILIRYNKTKIEKELNEIYNYLKMRNASKERELLKHYTKEYNQIIEQKIKKNMREEINKKEQITEDIIKLNLLLKTEFKIDIKIDIKITDYTYIYYLLSLLINNDDIILSIIQAKKIFIERFKNEIKNIKDCLVELKNIYISEELINHFKLRYDYIRQNYDNKEKIDDITDEQKKQFKKICPHLQFDKYLNEYFKIEDKKDKKANEDGENHEDNEDGENHEANEDGEDKKVKITEKIENIISFYINCDDDLHKIIYKLEKIYYCFDINLKKNIIDLYIYNQSFKEIVKNIRNKLNSNDYNKCEIFIIKEDDKKEDN